MKILRHRLLVAAFIIVLSLVAFLMARPGLFSLHQPLNSASKAFEPHLSVLITQQKQQISSSFQGSHISEREPAPLDHPSEEELHEFPGAVVVEAIELEGPEKDQKIRLRILKTHFKYPLIRTEEIIDGSNNGVVTREEMVADHFLVTLPEGADPGAFLKNFGSQATSITRVTADAPLYRVDLASSSLEALPKGLERAHATTAKNCEPDIISHARLVPNDPFYTQQWGLWPSFYYRDPAGVHWFNAGIDAEAAWDIQTSAASIIVAVIDSGIRYTHEDLAENIWKNPAPTDDDKKGCSILDKNGNLICCGINAYGDGTPDSSNGNPMDVGGHGTYCAGILGAVGNNGVGTTGVAWKVQLMACAHSDPNGSAVVSDSIKCINYAVAHGAKILNCSWGTGDAYSQDLFDAMDHARQAGVIIVAAAGNSSKNLDEDPDYPSSFALDNIVVVTATTIGNELAPTCNYGVKSVHLAAPGWHILGPFANDDVSYADGGGTSAAAPFVTGALALFTEKFKMESYQTLIARLLASTDPLPLLEGKTVTGGRLNLAKALTQSFFP